MAKTARLNYFATRSTFINERYVQGAFLHAAAMPLLHPISHVVEIIFEVTTKDTFVNKLYLQKDDEGDGWMGSKIDNFETSTTTYRIVPSSNAHY